MKHLLNPTQIIIFSIILIIGSVSLTSCSSSSDSEDVPPTTQESEEEQIPNETEEEIPIEPEETVFFSKMSYENIVNNIVQGRVEFQFEGNKVIREDGLSADGVLQNFTTYGYDDKGLLKTRIEHTSDGTVEIIEDLNYENDNLSSIRLIRRNRAVPDTLFTSFVYTNNLITRETLNPSRNRLFYSEFTLDANGFITKSDNGIIAEVAIENGAPISKSVIRSDGTDEFQHAYLENTEPTGPFKNFWGSFYGNINNQIIRSNSGLISYEDTVDLPLYIVSVGDQLQREYEFDVDGLPIRLTKTFNSDFISTWQIEYLE
ncbi:hypothetical protein [Flagellimonas meishanensis]|uniref:hypothetical protein n=1 Tax=Flagellimonas meishanensis TaxID=2873264 RepID=UPI001CA76119|nr:hypothetical protein [[Muricauda] meishanensis]